MENGRSTEGNLSTPLARGMAVIPLVLAGLPGLSQPAASADDGRLVNLSTRALVGTGDEVMLGGFIIEDGPRQALIQALGPELANAGISNALADPVLTVIDNETGEDLMFNDNWEDSQRQMITEAWGGNPNLTAGSLSSAVILTLGPGAYTAKVEGKDGTTGVALVELYEIESPGVGSPDRETLAGFYNATNGAGWTRSDNWGTAAPLDQWHGVTVDGNGRVIELRLHGNQLRGPIPAELSELPHLKSLYLWDNQLSGSIPPELGNLPGLQALILSGNQLSGPIPAELGNLAGLHTLILGTNRLSGAIPPELGNLPELRILSLEYNQFQVGAEIPPQLGGLTNLEELRLASAGIWGRVPAELANLTGLRVLELHLNNLEGEIPPWMGNLTELERLTLAFNNLKGPIPPELGALAQLEELFLQGNTLSGPIPASLLALDRLRDLEFYFNEGLCAPGTVAFVGWFDGINHDGPYCNEGDIAALTLLHGAAGGEDWTNSDGWLGGAALGNWHGVTADSMGRVLELDLSQNGLTGRLPASLGHLDRMTSLRIGGNALAGPLPMALARLPLRELHYADTELCAPATAEFRAWLGTIPSHEGTGAECDLTDREVLTALYEATGGPNWFISYNWLTEEPLDEWHGIATNSEGRVVGVDLNFNNLVGRIPPEAGFLDELGSMILSSNSLGGEIPSEIGNLANLYSLWLDYNQLGGSMPAEIGQLAALQSLDLSYNRLSGSIPAELGNLARLNDLNLSSNQLSGPLPPELGSLEGLTLMWLGNNRFDGSLPDTLFSLSSLRQLALFGNQLSGPLPAGLGRLSGLGTLNLANNLFSGELPGELGDLPELYELYLNGNPELSGPLPRNLASGGIGILLAHGTRLCVPDEPVFGNWLSSMQAHRIRSCAWMEASAYLTQATQSREYPVPLVAGESALLRVFVTSQQETSQPLPPVRATFFLDGAEAHVAEIPAGSAAIPTEMREGNLGLSANVEIPGSVIRPGLEMVVEIDPGRTVDPALGLPGRIPAEGREAVEVWSMPTLNLTLVPFIWAGSNNRATADLVEELHADHELFWETKQLLPVAALEITKHVPVLVDSNDPSDLLDETLRIRTVEGGDGHWMGLLLHDAASGFAIALQGGKTSFVQPHEESGPTIAHELGHNFSLGHAPCDVDLGLDPHFPDPFGRVGSWGYDPRHGGSLVPPDFPDLMGYCEPQWIGDYNYSKALRFRIADEGAVVVDDPEVLAAVKSLLVSGRVEADSTLHLDPAFIVEAPPVFPNGSGPYALAGRRADGSELFSMAFEMTEVADGDGRSSFLFALPVQAAWESELARIVLSGPDGAIEMREGSEPPKAITRDPRTGQVRAILDNVSALPRELLSQTAALDATVGEGVEAGTPGLEVMVSRGIPDAVAWRQ